MSSTTNFSDYLTIASEILGVDFEEPNSEGWVNCQCPFHDDRHPSFGINAYSGVYHCFRCGSGSFYDFLLRTGKDKDEAARIIQSIKTNLKTQGLEEVVNHRRQARSKIFQANFYLASWMRSRRGRYSDNIIENVSKYFDTLSNFNIEKAYKFSMSLMRGDFDRVLERKN
jgi:hypothetical protein